MKYLVKNLLIVFLIFLIISGVFTLLAGPSEKTEEISLSQLVEQINQEKVSRIVVQGEALEIEFQDETKAKAHKEKESSLTESLKNYGVDSEKLKMVNLEIKEEGGLGLWLGAILPFLLPFLIIGAFIWFMLRGARQGQMQAFSFGRSKARLFTPESQKEKVTFNDVAGLKEAKVELQEIVDFLKNPKKFTELGARIPKGALLIGAPGTGKTLLARAVANEARVPFFHVSGSEFVEMFVGVGSSRVRDLFQTAKKNAPCLPGETLITLSDGQEIPIEEMYNKKMVGVYVPSMQDEFKVENAKVIAITRRKKKGLYQIKTYHSSIKATNNHRFPVLRNGQLKWIEAAHLKKGDYIASPRQIKTSQENPSLINLLPKNTRLYFKGFDRTKGGRKRKQLKSVKLKGSPNFEFSNLVKIALGRGGWTDCWLNKIPQFLNENILYLTGLISADGNYPKNSRSINFVNTNKTLINLVSQIVKRNFSYTPRVHLNKKHYQIILPQGQHPKKLKDCYTVYINNKLIRIILQKAEQLVNTLPKNLIAAWLKGLFDGDGYVSQGKNFPKVVISASDKNLNHQIRAALHRIGIVTYCGKKVDNIEITGKNNLSCFAKKVSSAHPDKFKKLQKLNLAGEISTRLDAIPVGNLLKKARCSIQMGQRQFWRGHQVCAWERNLVRPTRHNLQKRVKAILEWASRYNKTITEEIRKLQELAFSDIIWTKILEIKKMASQEYVYDLCLNDHHNFVANGMFVHNCIIFLDELDAIGRQRGIGIGGAHDEREQTLNQILVEMDGFEPNSGVIVLSATNRPDVLDVALLRPGRFDRRIILDEPDIQDREDILKIHTRNKHLAKDVSLREIAERTPGFSGADLANLVNEAALLAARRDKKQISQAELRECIEKVLLGPERKSHILSKKEKEIAAYHEAGHALVNASLPHTDPVHKVSIISRGRAAGYTLKLPVEDRHLRSRSEFLDELAVLLGGYATEELIFNELTTGASSDLRVASDLARKLVTQYGMSEKLGPVAFGSSQELPFLGREFPTEKNYSEEIAAQIDQEVAKFIDQAYQTAKKILIEKRKKLDQIAKYLIKKETIERKEFERIMGKTAKKKKSSRK